MNRKREQKAGSGMELRAAEYVAHQNGKDHSDGISEGTGKEVLGPGKRSPGYSKDLCCVCVPGLCGKWT